MKTDKDLEIGLEQRSFASSGKDGEAIPAPGFGRQIAQRVNQLYRLLPDNCGGYIWPPERSIGLQHGARTR